ncbi:MAG: DUF1543 domain-containing protein [Flavobacterium sp.]|uniref:DUF1543 domain-containing protein n=1 Tax=Flavobacterium sp. TaxID=239 RepID=UPI00297387F1|nr:MAG: DUF1543 domain-containing protein [Flavobacteriia bacterium]
MKTINLHMIMLGCTPKGRFTEQHDIFFGIGTGLKDLVPDMNAFWPEANGRIHIDAWQKITTVNGFSIEVVSKETPFTQEEQLFFLNLGGYKEGEFEEYHYKVIVVAKTKAKAIKKAKQTTFYKHYGFKGAESHIDDKYGIDVDDIHNIEDILSEKFKLQYRLKITKTNATSEDEKHIGYLKIDKISE